MHYQKILLMKSLSKFIFLDKVKNSLCLPVLIASSINSIRSCSSTKRICINSDFSLFFISDNIHFSGQLSPGKKLIRSLIQDSALSWSSIFSKAFKKSPIILSISDDLSPSKIAIHSPFLIFLYLAASCLAIAEEDPIGITFALTIPSPLISTNHY